MGIHNESGGVTIRSLIQGFGLSLFMASYMFSWTVGALVGLSSFAGIGLFLLVGFLIVFVFSTKKISAIAKSVGEVYYLIFFISFIFFLAIFFGDTKDVAWISLGFVAIILISAIDAKSSAGFCIGFSIGAFIYCSMFVWNARDAAALANSYGDTSRASFSEENAAYTLIAYACAFCFVTAFYNYVIGNVSRLFAVACMFVSMLGIILAGTRSVYGGVALATGYTIFVGFRRAKSLRPTDIAMMLLLVAAAVLLLSSGYMGDRINALAESVQHALDTFFGGRTGLEDASAAGRVYQRGYAWHLFEDNPFFGAGFKSFWVDIPLLQAFSDLGFFFGCAYALLFFIIPLRICIHDIKYKSEVGIFLCLIYICNVPRLFFHGQPYDWVVFTYVFLPYFGMLDRRSGSVGNIYRKSNMRNLRKNVFSERMQ